jgi:signal transduction histidine kinase
MLLQLSRMDQSGNALTLAPVPLAPIVAEAVRAAGLENDPRVHVDSLPESVVTQPDALVQLLRNLLENAAAYTPAEGRITVAGEANELRVKDTGAGIAAEHLPHLFERFYRADPSRARTSGGYGLGLSIAQGLAQAMHAQLRVESELGSGTTFFINFSGTDVSS